MPKDIVVTVTLASAIEAGGTLIVQVHLRRRVSTNKHTRIYGMKNADPADATRKIWTATVSIPTKADRPQRRVLIRAKASTAADGAEKTILTYSIPESKRPS